MFVYLVKGRAAAAPFPPEENRNRLIFEIFYMYLKECVIKHVSNLSPYSVIKIMFFIPYITLKHYFDFINNFNLYIIYLY